MATPTNKNTVNLSGDSDKGGNDFNKGFAGGGAGSGISKDISSLKPIVSDGFVQKNIVEAHGQKEII